LGNGGTSAIDLSLLTIPARRRLVTDERSLPSGDPAVAARRLPFYARGPWDQLASTPRIGSSPGDDSGTRVELDRLTEKRRPLDPVTPNRRKPPNGARPALAGGFFMLLALMYVSGSFLAGETTACLSIEDGPTDG
jgi:hypothetical protein